MTRCSCWGVTGALTEWWNTRNILKYANYILKHCKIKHGIFWKPKIRGKSFKKDKHFDSHNSNPHYWLEPYANSGGCLFLFWETTKCLNFLPTLNFLWKIADKCLENLKQATGQIYPQVCPPFIVSTILCCEAWVYKSFFCFQNSRFMKIIRH